MRKLKFNKLSLFYWNQTKRNQFIYIYSSRPNRTSKWSQERFWLQVLGKFEGRKTVEVTSALFSFEAATGILKTSRSKSNLTRSFTMPLISNNSPLTIHYNDHVYCVNPFWMKNYISFWLTGVFVRGRVTISQPLRATARKWVIESLVSKYSPARQRRNIMWNHQTIFIGGETILLLKAFAPSYHVVRTSER